MIGVKCGSRDLSGDGMVSRDGGAESSIMNEDLGDPRSEGSPKASDRAVHSLSVVNLLLNSSTNRGRIKCQVLADLSARARAHDGVSLRNVGRGRRMQVAVTFDILSSNYHLPGILSIYTLIIALVF